MKHGSLARCNPLDMLTSKTDILGVVGVMFDEGLFQVKTLFQSNPLDTVTSWEGPQWAGCAGCSRTHYSIATPWTHRISWEGQCVGEYQGEYLAGRYRVISPCGAYWVSHLFA